MIYPLKLTLPFGNFTQPDESRKQVKEKLESIHDFEKRLLWYNANVRSLATHASEKAQVFYEWGNPDQRLFIFCNCNDCRRKPDFNKKKEAIYKKLRTKEIERLKAVINNANSYKDKLHFLFDTKGFIPEQTPAIWDGKTDEPIIDLRPETAEERRVYNQFIIADFEREYKEGNRFTPLYNGFDFEKERQRLNERLQQPGTDKPVLLQYVKTQIEKHFDYPESLHTDKREKNISSHVLKQIDQNLEQNGHIHNLFARLCFGETIDLLSVTGLNNYSLLNYTHVSEIFSYYQYVKQLIEKPENLTKLEFFNTEIDLNSFFNSSIVREAITKVGNDLKNQKVGYLREYESLIHYLKKKGYILPKDYKDFLHWLFGEKYGHLPFYEAAAKKISDADFLEYHVYRKNGLINKQKGQMTNINQLEKISDFISENPEFERLKNELEQKLETTKQLINQEEFLEAEIQRVEDLYSRPEIKGTVTQGKVVGGFEFYKYRQLAYDWLNSGLDYKIENILNSAKEQYRQSNPYRDGYQNSDEFKEAIIKNLQIGVAWLRYRKYLKDVLEKWIVDRQK